MQHVVLCLLMTAAGTHPMSASLPPSKHLMPEHVAKPIWNFPPNHWHLPATASKCLTRACMSVALLQCACALAACGGSGAAQH